MSHQFFHVVLPSHALQLLAASFHLLLRMSQTAAQLLVCDGQGLVAANNGHHRGLRAVIEVCCRNKRMCCVCTVRSAWSFEQRDASLTAGEVLERFQQVVFVDSVFFYFLF